MPGTVDRDEVGRALQQGDAVVAEVLPHPEYAWAHLPGALHLPLKGWSPEALDSQFGGDRPVIVYCNDFV